MLISECGYVYMITCIITNKIYVGSTQNFDYRFNQYYNLSCKSQRRLYNSFMSYGVNNHTFEVVWAGLLKDMLRYETMIGIYYEVLDNKLGLNCKLPKINDVYSFVSIETRNKISNSNKGRKCTDIQRINQSIRMKNGYKSGIINLRVGKTHSEESKMKMRNNNLGKKLSTKTKIKIGLANIGKVFSNESKAKQSLAKIGKKHTKEHRDKLLAYSRKIYQYDKNDNFIKEWTNISDIVRCLEICKVGIYNCCNNKRKSAGGFKWKYDKGGFE